MFILDSLMISGIRWALETALTAAEAEMNDDSVLREQLLEAEMRREMGEISDEAFADLEADLLARIREIKERREGAGPLEFGAQPIEAAGDDTFKVEASISGDFHNPADAPHTTVLEPLDRHAAVGGLVGTHGWENIEVLDLEPADPGRSNRSGRSDRARSDRSGGSDRSATSARSRSDRSRRVAASTAVETTAGRKSSRTGTDRAQSIPTTTTSRTAGTSRTRTARTVRTPRTTRTK